MISGFGLKYTVLEFTKARIVTEISFARVLYNFLKIKLLLVVKLVGFETPNNIQSRRIVKTFTLDGGIDGFITKGELCKVNVWLNDDGWNVNVNKFNSSNMWNVGNRSFFRNKYFLLLNLFILGGSFCFYINSFFPSTKYFPDFL